MMGWKKVGLYALLALFVITLTTTFLEAPQGETWQYERFLQEVQAGRVERVHLTSERTKAIVTAEDGTRVRVNKVPNDPQLSSFLAKNKVEMLILPQQDNSIWFKALTSLFFPILVLTGAFLLLRRLR